RTRRCGPASTRRRCRRRGAPARRAPTALRMRDRRRSTCRRSRPPACLPLLPLTSVRLYARSIRARVLTRARRTAYPRGLPGAAPCLLSGGSVIDFGLVDAVDAEAIGEPGHRTFRVRARAGNTFAALWIEKEQLAALGRGISQLLADRSLRRGLPASRARVVDDFVDHPDVEME